MSNIRNLHNKETMAKIFAHINSLPDRDGEPYHGGGSGGGGGMSDLTPRVARLEDDLKEMRADMKDVRDRLKGLEVKVDHLPSKGFIVNAMLVGLSAVAAVTLFQEKLATLFGLTP